MQLKTISMYVFLILLVVLMLSWVYSRYLITYTHEYTSWYYHFIPYPEGTEGISLEISGRYRYPFTPNPFFTIIFEEMTSRGEIGSDFLISEFDPFSQLFWYDKKIYQIKSPEVGCPLDVTYDRKQKKCTFQIGSNVISIIKNGRIIGCNDIGIVVNQKKPIRVYISKDKTIRIETENDSSSTVLSSKKEATDGKSGEN